MWRYMLVCAFGAMLAVARPAVAQGPPDKGNLKNLEAEIEKLRGQIQNLERLLKKTQESRAEEGAPQRRPGGDTGGGFYMKKKDGKPMGFGGPGFGGPGFGGPGAKKKDGKGFGDEWAEKKEEWAKKKKDFPSGGFAWGKKQDADRPAKDSPWARKMQGKGPWADWAEKRPAFAEKSKRSGKGPPFGRPPWASAGFGRGVGGGFGPRGEGGRDIERRLERIQEEIEQLRRDLRRR